MSRLLLMDGRARTDVDRASVMDTAETEAEAAEASAGVWRGHDAVWVQVTDAGQWILREDLSPQGSKK